jgi:hypothetical protein
MSGGTIVLNGNGTGFGLFWAHRTIPGSAVKAEHDADGFHASMT